MCSDANNIKLENESVDIIIWCWFFWTIISQEKQDEIFNEMNRVLKKWWKIILVENSDSWDFERIRWKNIIFPNPTKSYNNNLIKKYWFKNFKNVNTYFKFKDIQEAKRVFWFIRWENTSIKINSNIINHDVTIFSYSKK